MDDFTLHHGDCLEAMAAMEAGSVDAVCTDSPYGISFMGRGWDHTVPGVEFWTEALRLLKPSCYLVSMGGTRTWHRLACAIEDAGFEIRDTLMWLHGQGFPKGKSCLKPAWEPIILARKPGPMRELGIEECRIEGQWATKVGNVRDDIRGGNNATGTGKKGVVEDSECHPAGRWPANLILECTCDETRDGTALSSGGSRGAGGQHGSYSPLGAQPDVKPGYGKEPVRIHTDPNCPCAMLDGQTGNRGAAAPIRGTEPSVPAKGDVVYGFRDRVPAAFYGDSGGASRFFLNVKGDGNELDSDEVGPMCPRMDGLEIRGDMADSTLPEVRCNADRHSIARFLYCAKASRSERNAGCEGMEAKHSGIGALASEQGGEYLDFSHPAPDGIGEWLRQHRERAGMTARELCALVGSHGAVNHGGAVTNWEKGSSRPTPDDWRKLKTALGFDGRYDDAMTSLSHVPHATRDGVVAVKANHHPTVKPLALMRWLVKLVAQPGDVVLDPFAGSGTTGVACVEEGREFIGIEREAEYVEIARRRIEHASAQGRLKV